MIAYAGLSLAVTAAVIFASPFFDKDRLRLHPRAKKKERPDPGGSEAQVRRPTAPKKHRIGAATQYIAFYSYPKLFAARGGEDVEIADTRGGGQQFWGECACLCSFW